MRPEAVTSPQNTKEDNTMNKKYIFRATANEDYSKPDNNYNVETEYIITDGVYDFSDCLNDLGVAFEQVNDTFYLVDETGERTGEAYLIISVEDTDDELIGFN